MPFNLKQIRDSAEKEAITTALNYCDSNMSKAAELLGVTRPTLYNLMEKLAMTERELSEKESLCHDNGK